MNFPNVLDQMFDSLEHGRVDSAADCLTSGAIIWHSYDQLAQGKAKTIENWKGFVASTIERKFVDVRRIEIDGGYVQQHLMCIKDSDGYMVVPACLVAKVEAGKISRLDEYVSPRDMVRVADLPIVTPGLECLP